MHLNIFKFFDKNQIGKNIHTVNQDLSIRQSENCTELQFPTYSEGLIFIQVIIVSSSINFQCSLYFLKSAYWIKQLGKLANS